MTYSLEGCCDRSFQFNSIHAPEKGATLLIGVDVVNEDVSIHAPGKGATVHPAEHVLPAGVSIHAPARGATYGTAARSTI